MKNVIVMKQSLDYYLQLFDTRMSEGDYLGGLDAGRNVVLCSKTRIDKNAGNLLISQAYYEMGQYVLSCEYAFRSVKNISTKANAYFCIGRNLAKLNRPKLALKYFSEVLNCGNDPTLVGAVFEWCNFIREELMTNHNKTNILLAVKTLVRLKRYDEALQELEPYLQSNDLNYQILYCDILVMTGEHERAREILQQILRFDRHNIGALIVLANISFFDDDEFSLEQNLDKLDNLPLNSSELEAVANIYAKCGRYEKAIKNYEKILKNDEFSIKTLLFVAICYYNLKNFKEALYYIGRARWIDIDNPTLNIFYEIINTQKEENLPISTQIPRKTGQEKLNFVFEAINLHNFDGIFETSLTLAGDIEWSLTIKNSDFSQKIIEKLANSRNKAVNSLYSKLLLTLRIGGRQKFHLAKYALSESKAKAIDFTNDMRYHSFKLKIPHFMAENQVLRLGFCGAVAYSEICNIAVNLDKTSKKLKNKNFESIDFAFTENLISCLFFYENNQILEQACIYFNTPKNEVKEAIKCLKLA